MGGDSAMVSVLLSKYNVAAQKRDTIGLLRQIYHSTVYNYTFFDLLPDETGTIFQIIIFSKQLLLPPVPI